MNVLIICFSQTGNTQKLADRISKGIVDSGNRCSTIGMKHTNIDEIPNYDLIGIGTPMFGRFEQNQSSFLLFTTTKWGAGSGGTFFWISSRISPHLSPTILFINS